MEKNIRLNNYINAIHDYSEAHTTPPDQVLYELERETHLKTLAPQMMSGHLQGFFLQMISQLKRPKTILEVGTFTGYASICLARGLADEGRLYTIEVNEELAYISNKYFDKAGLAEKINPIIGDATTVIPTLNTFFDLVFIDAGKMDYALHYDLVFEKINPGGLILADNVLWSGKVVNREYDKDTASIRAFNQKIQNDERVENILLPIRDGLIVARKKDF